MKYMGSKQAMLRNGLGTLIGAESKGKRRIVDLFCGSAGVTWFAAQRFAVPVLAVDLQNYAVVLARAVLEKTTPIEVEANLFRWAARAKEWRHRKQGWKQAVELDAARLNTRTWASRAKDLCQDVRPRDAPLWKAYGGYYFSPKQALIFDSLLATLPIRKPHTTVCRAALIVAASKCVAAPGHTAQPFKATKTASRYLREAWTRSPDTYLNVSARVIFGLCAKTPGAAYIADANAAAQNVTEGDLVFIDPPYSGVQYSRFYHVLETIAVGFCGEVSGTGRYPPICERPGSPYSRTSESKKAFTDLMSVIADRGATAIVTFPAGSCSNGISGDMVTEICAKYFHVQKRSVKTRFSTMGGNNLHRVARKPSDELILLLRPR